MQMCKVQVEEKLLKNLNKLEYPRTICSKIRKKKVLENQEGD